MKSDSINNLPGVEYAAVYYDVKRAAKTNTPGRWMTVIRWRTDTARHVNLDEHATEADARAFIGLEGGSQDPEFHRASNVSRREVAVAA